MAERRRVPGLGRRRAHGDRVFAAAWRNGVVFRCFGDATLGFAPALTYTEAEFDQLFARLRRTLDDVLAQSEVRAALA